MVDKNKAVVCYLLAALAIMYPKRGKESGKCGVRSGI